MEPFCNLYTWLTTKHMSKLRNTILLAITKAVTTPRRLEPVNAGQSLAGASQLDIHRGCSPSLYMYEIWLIHMLDFMGFGPGLPI